MPNPELLRTLGFARTLLLRRPFDVCVQLTHHCNLRCSFCHFWGRPPSQELSLRDHQNLSLELSRLGTFLVSLEGGEPLLRADLEAIVAAYARHHLPVLYTNGTLMTPSRARDLFSAGLHQVGVSIDFSSAEPHDQARGLPGTWQAAWQAVHWLKEAAPHAGRQVHLMSLLMQANRLEWESLLQQSQEAGVGHHFTLLSARRTPFRGPPAPTTSTPYPQETLQPPLPPCSDHLLSLWECYPHLRTFRDYLAHIDRFLEGQPMPACPMGNQMFNIGPDGAFSPCNERLELSVGSFPAQSVPALLARLKHRPQGSRCQDCWLLCRGFATFLGDGASARVLGELVGRNRG